MKTEQFKCPACGREIPNRKAKVCAYCEQPLSKELRFTDAQIAKQKKDELARKKHKALWSPVDSGIAGAGDIG
jgi:ribosomal protein L37E